MKFSSEEEQTVIELQGQFGNNWARIATYSFSLYQSPC
ncbi:SANT/Myb-like DNA-binding domain-containing protein, partial [Pseudomonas syringae]